MDNEKEQIMIPYFCHEGDMARAERTTEIIPVFDELMTTLQVLHPRLYDGVLNKL